MDASPGKKPKTAELIRERLARVQELAEQHHDSGPYAAGLQPTDRFPVATFADERCALAYQQRLLEVGVYSTFSPYRGRTAVLIDLEDRERATEILADHLRRFPDRKHRRTRGFEATISLTLMAVLCCLFVTLASGASGAGGIAWGAIASASFASMIVTVHAAFCGLMVDLVRSRQLDLTTGQFNLLSVLALTMAAAILSFWLL